MGASRYPVSHSKSLFSLGLHSNSSSTTFLGPDEVLVVREGDSGGLESPEAVAMDWVPLQVVLSVDALALDGWKELSCVLIDSDGVAELTIVPVGSDFVRLCWSQLIFKCKWCGKGGDEGWNSSCLMKLVSALVCR